MKGGDEGRGGSRKQAAYAGTHFLRGFVGERDGQHSGTGHVLRLDQVRYAVGDDTCLAASGTGEKKHWPFDMRNGFTLLGIETCKKIHRRRIE